jgi:ABC-type Fe3+-hydroxamate transport system substrate-binding protein
MRAVSLVPSLTEAVAALGLADALVGVTRWCEVGAPDAARRIGGTKNPDVPAIVALAPDVVLANREENRAEDLDGLRAAGLAVHETFPRAVDDVAPMLEGLAAVLGVPGAADEAAAAVAEAAAAAVAAAPRTPVAACTLIWRKPWMAVGPDTFVDDLLRRCGFANVLAGWDERYPRLDPSLVLRPEVVLLPSEPYAFGEDDLPAVRDLLGDVPHRFVDGRILTWHGPSTAEALRTFSALAVELDAAR